MRDTYHNIWVFFFVYPFFQIGLSLQPSFQITNRFHGCVSHVEMFEARSLVNKFGWTFFGKRKRKKAMKRFRNPNKTKNKKKETESTTMGFHFFGCASRKAQCFTVKHNYFFTQCFTWEKQKQNRSFFENLGEKKQKQKPKKTLKTRVEKKMCPHGCAQRAWLLGALSGALICKISLLCNQHQRNTESSHQGPYCQVQADQVCSSKYQVHCWFLEKEVVQIDWSAQGSQGTKLVKYSHCLHTRKDARTNLVGYIVLIPDVFP